MRILLFGVGPLVERSCRYPQGIMINLTGVIRYRNLCGVAYRSRMLNLQVCTRDRFGAMGPTKADPRDGQTVLKIFILPQLLFW